MKKCRKIRAQAYVQRRIRAEGACLRSDRKIPTRTKRTRIVGSLSSNEFTDRPREYQGYGSRAGATIERRYQTSPRSRFGNCGEYQANPIVSMVYGGPRGLRCLQPGPRDRRE